jgi:zinc transporter 5/7
MLSTLSVLSAVALTLFSLPSALRTQKKVGLAMGCLLAAAFGVYDHPDAWQAWVIVPLACVLLFSAVCFDTSSGIFPPHTHDHSHSGHKHSKAHAHHLHGNHSKLSAFLIARCTPGSILHSILIERDSRRIAYFGV